MDVSYEIKAKIAKALAHPTRLFIIDRLRKRDVCVCEFVELIDADQSTVSKHLAVLRSAGIVSTSKDGNKVFYHLETPCVVKFLECATTVIAAALKKQTIAIAK